MNNDDYDIFLNELSTFREEIEQIKRIAFSDYKHKFENDQGDELFDERFQSDYGKFFDKIKDLNNQLIEKQKEFLVLRNDYIRSFDSLQKTMKDEVDKIDDIARLDPVRIDSARKDFFKKRYLEYDSLRKMKNNILKLDKEIKSLLEDCKNSKKDFENAVLMGVSADEYEEIVKLLDKNSKRDLMDKILEEYGTDDILKRASDDRTGEQIAELTDMRKKIRSEILETINSKEHDNLLDTIQALYNIDTEQYIEVDSNNIKISREGIDKMEENANELPEQIVQEHTENANIEDRENDIEDTQSADSQISIQSIITLCDDLRHQADGLVNGNYDNVALYNEFVDYNTSRRNITDLVGNIEVDAIYEPIIDGIRETVNAIDQSVNVVRDRLSSSIVYEDETEYHEVARVTWTLDGLRMSEEDMKRRILIEANRENPEIDPNRPNDYDIGFEGADDNDDSLSTECVITEKVTRKVPYILSRTQVGQRGIFPQDRRMTDAEIKDTVLRDAARYSDEIDPSRPDDYEIELEGAFDDSEYGDFESLYNEYTVYRVDRTRVDSVDGLDVDNVEVEEMFDESDNDMSFTTDQDEYGNTYGLGSGQWGNRHENNNEEQENDSDFDGDQPDDEDFSNRGGERAIEEYGNIIPPVPNPDDEDENENNNENDNDNQTDGGESDGDQPDDEDENENDNENESNNQLDGGDFDGDQPDNDDFSNRDGNVIPPMPNPYDDENQTAEGDSDGDQSDDADENENDNENDNDNQADDGDSDGDQSDDEDENENDNENDNENQTDDGDSDGDQSDNDDENENEDENQNTNDQNTNSRPRTLGKIISDISMDENQEAYDLTMFDQNRVEGARTKVTQAMKANVSHKQLIYNILGATAYPLMAAVSGLKKLVNWVYTKFHPKKVEAYDKISQEIDNLSDEDWKVIDRELTDHKGAGLLAASAAMPIIKRKHMQWKDMKINMPIRERITLLYEELLNNYNQIQELKDRIAIARTDAEKDQLRQDIADLNSGSVQKIRELQSLKRQLSYNLGGGNGLHGIEEGIKAVKNRQNRLGKLFSKDINLKDANEFLIQYGKVDEELEGALQSGDDEAALEAFVNKELFEFENTKTKKTFMGVKDVGFIHWKPMPEPLNYEPDPLARYIATTIAEVGLISSAINNIHNIMVKNDLVRANNTITQQKNAIAQGNQQNGMANAHNMNVGKDIHTKGTQLEDQAGSYGDGMDQMGRTDIGTVRAYQEYGNDVQYGGAWDGAHHAADDVSHAYGSQAATNFTSTANSLKQQLSSGAISKLQYTSQMGDLLKTTHVSMISDMKTCIQQLQPNMSAYDYTATLQMTNNLFNNSAAYDNMIDGLVQSVGIGHDLTQVQILSYAPINDILTNIPTDVRTIWGSMVASVVQVGVYEKLNQKALEYARTCGQRIEDKVSETSRKRAERLRRNSNNNTNDNSDIDDMMYEYQDLEDYANENANNGSYGM